MNNSLPRCEYPRPQLVRESYINLNGEWQFEFDFGNSGFDRKLYESDEPFSKKITVPFCPESKLSGICCKDFLRSVWYKRSVNLTKGSGRTLLHFEAVDYVARVWINKTAFPAHTGGYTGFTLDITDAIVDGENTICLNAVDLMVPGVQPRGKQSERYYSHNCDYTRTTGIWQTVWIEQVAQTYIENVKVSTADLAGVVTADLRIKGEIGGIGVRAHAYYEGKEVGFAECAATSNTVRLSISLSEAHLWEVGNGRLYDITYELVSGGKTLDTANGYFGLRTISLRDGALCINNKKVYQRLVLDQGFYPDGVYTAQTDSELKGDIELSMKLGFNGARMHEKVFEQRFIYWADKLGYIVWGEFPNWGFDISTLETLATTLPQWLEEIDRDFSHPSIIGWCPFNETWDAYAFKGRRGQDDRILSCIYYATKAADSTRPAIDTSGNFHVVTDLYDIHHYEQDAEKFREMFKNVGETGIFETFPERQKYEGQPFWVSEFGGTWWAPGNPDGWGYGRMPKSEDEVINRIEGLTKVLLDCDYCCGFCYTQLTDVEQEQNGLVAFDRTPKFSEENYKRIRAALTGKAAIENE